MRIIFISALIFTSGLAMAQVAQDAVGPSAKWCKDRTIHEGEPARHRVITMNVGNAEKPQKCMELLDIQQVPVCRVKYDCVDAS